MANPRFERAFRGRGLAATASFLSAIAVTALLLSFSGSRAIQAVQEDCQGCRRSASLDKFINVHAPEYEARLEEWNKCMQGELGSYTTFNPDDPKLKQALERCSHLDPGASDYMFPSTVMSKLAEVLTSPCFHMAFAGGPHPPEYLFRGSFDAGIAGEKNSQGKDIRSRFILELYYNGSQPELVKSWTTESTLTGVDSQYNRMFDNHDAALRREKPIEQLLWDFERRPVRCEVDLGGVESVKPGEEIEIRLKDFKDAQGRAAKPFNRIIVQAVEGKVLNGEVLEVDKDLKAFTVGSGEVMVRYRAPEEAGVVEDKLVISNSCEILPPEKFPMSKTEMDDKIAEKTIPIGDVIVMAITETSSGGVSDGEDEYPFSYSVHMEFVGEPEVPLDEAMFGKEETERLQGLINLSRMPPELRKIAGDKRTMLLARLLPDESSMKVLSWQSSDPENDSPPEARFPRSAAASHIPESAAEAWLIGETVYIVRGSIDGILGYFASWEDDDELRETQKQPLGARVGGTWGDMKPYLEFPLEKLRKGQKITIRKEHSGTDGDAWHWTTRWTVTISYGGK